MHMFSPSPCSTSANALVSTDLETRHHPHAFLTRWSAVFFRHVASGHVARALLGSALIARLAQVARCNPNLFLRRSAGANLETLVGDRRCRTCFRLRAVLPLLPVLSLFLQARLLATTLAKCMFFLQMAFDRGSHSGLHRPPVRSATDRTLGFVHTSFS